MAYYVDVILPLALPKPFTYSIKANEKAKLVPGSRVAVPFGKTKVYTAVVLKIHERAPQTYVAKPIALIMDQEQSKITPLQMDLWNWMAGYYMSTHGDILRAALPNTYLLESETVIHKKPIDAETLQHLDDDAYLIYEALATAPLTIKEILAITGRKHAMPLINKMIQNGVVEMQQQIHEKYQPKYVRWIRINNVYRNKEKLKSLFDSLSKAPKQLELLLCLFKADPSGASWQKRSQITEKCGVSNAVCRSMLVKGILEESQQKEDRVLIANVKATAIKKTLSIAQENAYHEIINNFKFRNTVLLEGVTASGKTEVYIKLIENQLQEERQVLYLLPEISLTSQIVTRLVAHFGENVCVYHSKFSIQERTEVYENILSNAPNTKIIVGARSALFLPFQNLGFIIVDEEHETAFKQFDPAPRYHTRDAAIYFGHLAKAKVLLGSATPSIESAHNARIGKYGWVKLTERFGGIALPEVETIDLKLAVKKKQMQGAFSMAMIEAVRDTIAKGQQVILFQNRRGYAPIMECLSCGHTPQCTQCDVTLTFHQASNALRCHYCGYHIPKPQQCHACGMATLTTKGLGTQQIEEQIQELFPNVKVGRMDWDSTRGKWAFDKIIHAFSRQEIHILVGTQMVVKGLDFKNVHLVGVLNTDQLLNFPDFRAHERTFQMLCQVAGRSGRSGTRGKVLLQTYQPKHPVMTQVINHDYEKMFKTQIEERTNYAYPPFCRLIQITFKNKNYDTLNTASQWFTNVITQSYSGPVLGPVFPAVARVRNLYQKKLMIKIKNKADRAEVKDLLIRTYISFQAVAGFKNTRVNIDVDPY